MMNRTHHTSASVVVVVVVVVYRGTGMISGVLVDHVKSIILLQCHIICIVSGSRLVGLHKLPWQTLKLAIIPAILPKYVLC